MSASKLTRLEQIEMQNLAPYAIKSSESAGRKYPEELDKNRLPFQRDKDRIIHCKAFRRLEQKTQVFVAGSGDHYRTRLTHTLEVAQISRDLARRLALNEDLCEAIALAHDLGHPPFGHAGEAAIDEVMKAFGLHFEHNQQSKRIVEVLEKFYPGFVGLNLTFETLDGLIKHQTAYDQAGKVFEKAAHLEAQVVNVADEIAYTNHDMDDALRAGLIDFKHFRKCELWQEAEQMTLEKYGKIRDKYILSSRIIAAIMSLMTDDFCKNTLANIKKYKIKTTSDVKNFQGSIGCFSDEMKQKTKVLYSMLFEDFYMSEKVKFGIVKGKRMIKKLFNYYYKNPTKFPKQELLKNKEGIVIVIKDYIAGMTDPFITQEYKKAFKVK
ncbi:MAG: deoxyguanosinetriphosphate triphosphohydrolase [Patescibacteria group bacterium]